MSKLIGKSIATEKAPTTIDTFFFWTKPEVILHPFDVIKVDHLKGSTTYGVVEEISHLTDSASFLSNYISSDFGDAEIDENTMRIGMNYVQAKVIGNTARIDTPILSNTKVYLATKDEVNEALGLKNIENPVVCGYLDMYEEEGDKISLPVNINSDFLIGPEGAHLNISGISGLAAKTSYAMFLLKAIQDKYIKQKEMEQEQEQNEDDNGVAFVVFNVKGKDLLAIDEPNDFKGNEKDRAETFSKYEELNIDPTPFQNVTYLYPCSDCRIKNTYIDNKHFKTQISAGKAFQYKFDFEKDKANLDLMFANVDDPNQTMEAIINCILNEQGKFSNIKEWNRFIEVLNEMGEPGNNSYKEIPVQSWRKFSRMVKKSISNNCLFDNINAENSEVRIPDKIKDIRENDIFVVDIAKLDSNMQSFVFGNTIREIMDYQLGEKPVFEDGRKAPSRIVIFIDELNKYASSETPKNSPILRQILDIAERGRSLGVILFGAEQFMSAIHNRVTGNCAAFAYGRTNAIEVAKPNYRYIPKVYQNMMTRLKPGEYIVQSFSFTSLLHIKFPRPLYKQFKK